jgi:hypothetical protein
VHKAMNEKAWYGVKNKILQAVSIGFSVKSYEYITRGDEEFVKLFPDEIYELSVVSVGSLPQATIDSVKQLKGCSTLECTLESLQNSNPDCECLKSHKKEKQMEITKEAQPKVEETAIEQTQTEEVVAEEATQKVEEVVVETTEQSTEVVEEEKIDDLANPSEEVVDDLVEKPVKENPLSIEAVIGTLATTDFGKLEEEQAVVLYEIMKPFTVQVEDILNKI